MIDINNAIQTLVSSDGDLPLAIERYNKGKENKVNEYDFISNIISDPNSTELVAKQLRSLLTIKVFYIISQLQLELMNNLDAIPPKDLARTLASFVTAFSAMTAPATKISFDFESEAEKAANELGLTAEEVKLELKEIMSRNK